MSITTLPTAGRGVTPAMLARWARQHRSLAREVHAAQAFARSERERVDAYILPILAAHGFPTQRDFDFCEDEARCAHLFEEFDAAHRAHGFTGPEGHCPALSADWDRIQAENRLLKSAYALLGIEDGVLYGETCEKMLQLLLEVCQSS